MRSPGGYRGLLSIRCRCGSSPSLMAVWSLLGWRNSKWDLSSWRPCSLTMEPRMLSTPSKQSSWMPKSIREVGSGSLVRIRRRSVHRATFHKYSHEKQPSNSHQDASPPVFMSPLRNRLNGLFIEEEILEAGQRTIRIHASTFSENVTVSFVIVAGRARMKQESRLAFASTLIELPTMEFGELERRQTFAILLASQMTKLRGFALRQEAIFESDFGANGSVTST